MDSPITKDELDYLRTLDSPTAANAVESFGVRPRTEGYMTPGIRALFPELGPVVGYAATAVISAREPTDSTVPRSDLWAHVLSLPEPRVLVMQDVDEPALGAFWGEVQSNVFTALGCVGCITNGSVRDLNEARDLGFRFVAKEISVSHGYVHLTRVGTPVRVGGLEVNPGELLHGDQHGVVQIPIDLAPNMRTAVDGVVQRERRIIEFCQSPDFNVQKLTELMG